MASLQNAAVFLFRSVTLGFAAFGAYDGASQTLAARDPERIEEAAEHQEAARSRFAVLGISLLGLLSSRKSKETDPAAARKKESSLSVETTDLVLVVPTPRRLTPEVIAQLQRRYQRLAATSSQVLTCLIPEEDLQAQFDAARTKVDLLKGQADAGRFLEALLNLTEVECMLYRNALTLKRAADVRRFQKDVTGHLLAIGRKLSRLASAQET